MNTVPCFVAKINHFYLLFDSNSNLLAFYSIVAISTYTIDIHLAAAYLYDN